MRNRWLQQHSVQWVERGIITAEQREAILQLYTKRITAVQILTILGAILLGLAALSFVAANWQGMGPWWKVILIYGVMALSYHMGYEMDRRGLKAWSLSFGVLGVILFGVGLLLFEQLFHPPFLSELLVYLWSVGLFLVGYVYRQQWFPILGLLALNYAQWVGLGGIVYDRFYYLALFLLLFLPYLYRYGTRLLQVAALFSFSLNMWYLISSFHVGNRWMLAYAFLLLLLGSGWEKGELNRFFRYVGLLIAFIFTFFYGQNADISQTLQGPGLLLGITILMIGAYAVLVWRQGRPQRLLDLVLFTPLFLSGLIEVEWFYILMLYVASLNLITMGIRQHDGSEYNLGFIFFLVATLEAYSLLTWKMLNKSIFFLIGGLLLFLISFILQKQKKDWLEKGEDE